MADGVSKEGEQYVIHGFMTTVVALRRTGSLSHSTVPSHSRLITMRCMVETARKSSGEISRSTPAAIAESWIVRKYLYMYREAGDV